LGEKLCRTLHNPFRILGSRREFQVVLTGTFFTRYMKGILLAGGELSAAEDGKSGFQMTSPLLPKLDTLDAQADVHTSELFIKLLCQFEPDAVLNFLQSHQAYRVQVSTQSLS